MVTNDKIKMGIALVLFVFPIDFDYWDHECSQAVSISNHFITDSEFYKMTKNVVGRLECLAMILFK